ncbi:MAG: UDP-N-acetylmuramoyl-L-alanyl-D-glutamate--2,6-diaminopimelate ligase, partial [Candidatus Promineifilaceae bacterium]
GQRPLAEVAAAARGVPYLETEDSAVAEAWLAAAWHGFPGRELMMIGVTGTDGKTTTANLIYACLQAADVRAGMLSTIRAAVGAQEEPLALHVTTPEAPLVQAYLRRMVSAGLTHCVLETTSHGLAQHRVDAIPFGLAVVTNITHEHLDYHGDWDAYLAAKGRLIQALRGGAVGAEPRPRCPRTAVLNADDRSFEPLWPLAGGRVLSYALEAPADVRAGEVRSGPDGSHFQLCLPQEAPLPIESKLPGRFNVYNLLAAAAASWALGLKPEAIQAGLASVRGLSGRMERIDVGQPFLVVVDFAHTPNALEAAIAAARALAAGRVIAVFGSAGKRDVAKRRLMAEVSARSADVTVLTAEDPRTESLAAILEAMAAGCRAQGGVEGESFWRVPDRGQAIYAALALARPGDVVLICGKGHEQSMAFGATEYPWDDSKAARAALAAFLAGRPMPDLGLPTFRPDGG